MLRSPASRSAGTSAAGAQVGAGTAVVAQPDIDVSFKFVFKAPLSPNHFLTRVRIIGRRQGACYGAGSALVALLEAIATDFLQFLDELKIRFNANIFFPYRVYLLVALERVRTDLDHLADKVIDHVGNFVVFIDGKFSLNNTLGFNAKSVQRISDVFHTAVTKLRTLHKVALVVFTVFTTEQQNSINTLGHSIRNPDGVLQSRGNGRETTRT